ncbi:hypothetical protein E2C01_031490 [Portunus trituberculatus]|uniref:Uncharacterized protein n=1 Tax=Portunus trituberculatus TaxID=210409 RepID=A0A5B7F076_PORTR|nr:hypothetical protein [Portunus trituberculatus]
MSHLPPSPPQPCHTISNPPSQTHCSSSLQPESLGQEEEEEEE